jgi:DNA repair protein RadA/Sms
MVVAVLEAHAGLKLGMHDIYLNVAGGLRITEPAADLAAAAALVSSLSGAPLSPDSVYFGEIGLSGSVRPVAQAPARLKEAAKLGFTRAVTPTSREKVDVAGLDAGAIGHIADMVASVAAGAPRRKAVGGRRDG